ncbi:hypothetical protein [Saccharibacillus deserti]|uniref:hypothetical protein n=1 Tax=Saccharibacillus deserti TaxID=1634444 RepID=UPI001557DAB5|nr:hypothetical protein [Saccharibacillus deserti]
MPTPSSPDAPRRPLRRLAALILPIALCLPLAACAQGVVDVTVNRDGTADIRMDATIDESALDTIGQSDLPDQIAESLRKQGLETEAIHQDGQAGLSASRKVELDGGTLPEMPEGITVQNNKEAGWFTTTHNLVVIADPPELIPRESSSLTGLVGSRLLGRFVDNEFDFDFKLTLPLKPGANNADEISGNGRTLTWNLAVTRENRIELSFTVPNIRRIVYTASAVLLLVIAAVIAFLLRRKRRKKAASA